MKRIILLLPVIFFFKPAAANNDDLFKLGKMTKEEMDMKLYTPDSSAGAVILKDIGNVEFSYNNGKERFEYTYTRRTRIKIFNANQLEQANRVLTLYIGTDEREALYKLKGSTFNEEGGKWMETELK